jgi:Tfp pilus assembly PilM family ATPase
MKIPLLRPVVPPHVFCLLPEGITYASVRRDPPRGFAQSRHFPFPPNTVGAGPSGTPLLTREAIAQAVEAARRLSEGRLTRASVLFPDSWARVMPLEMETIPESVEAAREMVQWKLKKLLPGVTAELGIVFREMTPAGEQRRVLVAAAPADTLRSIENAFESVGVRVGALAPFSLALFEGLAPLLAAKAAGDYALLHRSADSFVFFVARGAAPIFFRQRPADEPDVDHDQDVRLSLSYYTEKLKGEGISTVYAYDVRGAAAREEQPFSVAVQPLSGRLLDADATFDERVASRPELLPAFAAVLGRK